MSVEPLALIVSLPNQLLAHIPITNISTQLTNLLETMGDDENMIENDSDLDEDHKEESRVPELLELFRPGQYVRAIVTAVHAQGSTDSLGLSKARDSALKASRRVELSLVPEKVNEGLVKSDLKSGLVSKVVILVFTLTNAISQTLSVAVRSVEDHGYALELGVPEVSGFLTFKDVEKGLFSPDDRFRVGSVFDVAVSKMSGNDRICNVSMNSETLRSASVS